MSANWKNETGATDESVFLSDASRAVEGLTGGVLLTVGETMIVFGPRTPASERLEFLGDRVAQLGAAGALLDCTAGDETVQLYELLKELVSNSLFAAHMINHRLHYYLRVVRASPISEKRVADTYETLLATVYLRDKQAALRMAYQDAQDVLVRHSSATKTKTTDKYRKLHLGRANNAAQRAFDPAIVHADFHEVADLLGPALEVHSLTKDRLQLLGGAVVKLAAAWRIYHTHALATPGDMEAANKLLLTPPLYQAFALQYAFDKAMWGSVAEIADANLRDTYEAVIGACWTMDPGQGVLDFVLSDLETVGGSTLKTIRASVAKVVRQYTDKQVRGAEYVQILNGLVPRIARKTQGKLISDRAVYVDDDEVGADGLFGVTVAVGSGVSNTTLKAGSGYGAPSSVPYFVAEGRATTKQAAKTEAARRLVVWMEAAGLVHVTGDEKYDLDSANYAQRVRSIFTGPRKVKYVALPFGSKWITVAAYMAE